ncbi:MAG: ABC transporter ATP-binding protein [bacterium]|nr:ABC transporter ATP-binding protein [bacterium]
MIRVENLVKSFDGRRVLDGVSFTAEGSKITVVMGGSGGGKSTLLRCMIGALPIDEGEIWIGEKEITRLSEEGVNEVRKRFGMCFQSGALFNSMTVGENVALPIREHTKLAEHVIRIMVKMKLELVGLRDAENLMPSQISGGMAKRVALARALALDPDIVFYDEPSAGLDPIVSSVIDELMMDLSNKLGITSIVITHELRSAFKIADHMVMLYKGRVAAEGSPEEIQSSQDPIVQQFITGSPEGPVPRRLSSKDYGEDLLYM